MAVDLDLAKKRFKLCQDTDSEQRVAEVSDLEFQVPEKQWDEAARQERSGKVQGNVPVPPRPMLSIDKIRQPIRLILNQARAADLGVNIHPVSENANKETAEVLQGLYRRIERDSNADQARLWAFNRAVKAGRGFYRISTRFDEESDPKFFDQEIRIERILHQENVYFDPAAQMADYSDADYCFLANYLSLEQFKVLYPNASISDEDGNDMFWESAEQQAPEWVRTNQDGTKALLICEYWYKEHNTREVKSNGRVRLLDEVKVRACHLCGMEALREDEWGGKYLPIVPVFGDELVPFDERRRFDGMIRRSKDGQKAYNFAASSFIERMALEPKSPWLAAEGQMKGYEDMWQQANTRNFPVLPYVPVALGDKQVPPPARVQLDQTGMSLAAMGLDIFDNFIQSTTAIYDPSLGREESRDKSGKAILALQQQSDAGTSEFLSNLADVSMNYEARVVLDLIPIIYDRPGRVTTILKGEEDIVEPVMLNAPFTKGEDGKPQPAGMMDRFMRKPIQEFNLLDARYGVSVDVGKSFQTRLQQGADEIGQILSSAPDLMPILGDIYFRFRDFPGAQAIADRLSELRKQTHPGLGEEDQDQADPQALKAQLQAMQQQMQEMQAQLQEASQIIETERVKEEAQNQRESQKQQMETERTMLKIQSAEKIAQAGNETKLVVADATDEKEQVEAAFDRQHESDRDQFEAAHEVGLAAMNARSGKELAAQNTELREPPKGRAGK